MSKVEVNEIDKQSGSTLTLGGSGTAVTLACGATQTGFGRTGAVDWQTTIKTGDFTASNGEGYFVNTTSGAVTVTLPASPSAGNIVAIADYAGTSASNKITINRNGSNFEGGTVNGEIAVSRQAITLVFADSTQGWLPVAENDSSFQQAEFVAATGGNTVATCGNFKIHTFTGPGTFCVSAAGNAVGSNTVSYLVIAGGGGGGSSTSGGGGGAGGYRESRAASDDYVASPLNAACGPGYNLPVSVQGYSISVGGGGAGGTNPPGTAGTPGVNSTFSTITSAGGGGGGNSGNVAIAGGSGGGGGFRPPSPVSQGAAGNTPSTTPPQGNNGGNAHPSTLNHDRAGGGGGAGAVGTTPSGNSAGPGGAGVTSSINGTPTTRAGGGGGGKDEDSPNGGTGGDGGPGGGGNGASSDQSNSRSNTAGTANTGGGGGGAGAGGPAPHPNGQTGGSGIVIIRYKFQ